MSKEQIEKIKSLIYSSEILLSKAKYEAEKQIIVEDLAYDIAKIQLQLNKIKQEIEAGENNGFY